MNVLLSVCSALPIPTCKPAQVLGAICGHIYGYDCGEVVEIIIMMPSTPMATSGKVEVMYM
jgi:hypothetical protein